MSQALQHDSQYNRLHSDNHREKAPTLSPSSNHPLSELTKWVAEDFQAVDKLIQSNVSSDVSLIPELASYLIQAGGKRIRPLLTLVSAKLCGYEGQSHLYMAAAVEFIHTATLLHDDVVDESALRRGKPSANEVWGNQASVLVGDFLFSRSFQMMVKTESIPALESLSHAASVLAKGEVMQLVDVGNLDISEATYLKIISAKTATLFESACEVGGLISKAPKPVIEALKQYGLCLGIAFQMIDDILDYSALEANLGKQCGDDLREKKVTLPVIHAYGRSCETDNQKDKAFWQRLFTSEYVLTDSDLSQAQHLITHYKSLDYCRNQAKYYGDKAINCLNVFSSQAHAEIIDHMKDLVHFTINRTY